MLSSVLNGLSLRRSPSTNVALVSEEEELKHWVFDNVRVIRDPEKTDSTLEDLGVVREDLITVRQESLGGYFLVCLHFVPTVPHCSLATLIGLCIRARLEKEEDNPHKFKLEIQLLKGSHNSEADITKQINDKERVAAAMENPGLRETVKSCINVSGDYC